MFLNWRIIEKLEAKVPGQEKGIAANYRGQVEFNVLLGRGSTPLSLTGEDHERFRIENKELGIMVEGETLAEAKKKLRAKLAASENFDGTWRLWLQLDASGGHEAGIRHSGEERAHCSIEMKFTVELTTGKRKRHTHMPGSLPNPFDGKFPIPRTHKELSRLQEGPAVPVKERWNRDEIWVEATPELIATLRMLQVRLGESGAAVKKALSKTDWKKTIAAVQSGQASRLLSTSLVDGVNK
jgi:hypothetical protein